ncbi:MAG TPA: HD domain-containing protein [Spirochaetota bacterium]|nr:HD domain-containing protein [Spirochaetota bacterium]
MKVNTEYCSRLLIDSGFWAFYAFETARDMLIQRKPSSLKILTNADLLQLSRLFPEVCFRNGHQEHARLQTGGRSVMFYVSDALPEKKREASNHSELKRKALRKATSHTPFLINGFFYDLEDDLFYDPLDAYSLLKRGQIRTRLSPEAVEREFPLLALKTAKVYSETGFEVDGELDEYLKQKESLAAYERMSPAIAQDFVETLTSAYAYRSIRMLDEWGIVDTVFPELAALKSVDQDKEHHPEGNGFLHTLNCLNCVKKPKRNLMMAILLHDTGKAVTKENGRTSLPFPDHSSASKVIAKKVLNRFSFSREDTEEVLFLVRYHMLLGGLDCLPEGRLKKFFRSPYFPNLLDLYRADIESGYHNTENYYRAARMYREYLRKERYLKNGTYASHG